MQSSGMQLQKLLAKVPALLKLDRSYMMLVVNMVSVNLNCLK